ncbi:uncharacterized protein LOC132902149 [Amyelois transitella]|uniref:uncharacterized protein LOC132902149 n=1 Tax=Amyelois transitella TaxID=680683 RepID=UPI00298F7046|nr:uncharacterized protein LOC132902149 [Amyelois transitella]
MVLLSPSSGALKSLLRICESHAVAHGLRYNARKSEFVMFRPNKPEHHRFTFASVQRYPTFPQFTLNGETLKRVDKFKYLGHWVTADQSDGTDMERERRALSVRCNMLARRFARCTEQVKITLFKAYCQSFYTCSLWVNFTQRTYSDLRVQYNNAYRVLMRLPRYCSASTMFAVSNIPSFAAIMRARCASIMRRLRGSRNSILGALSDRWDSPLLRRWVGLHAPEWSALN